MVTMIIRRTQKITIIRMSRPERNLNQELQWLGTSLGLFNLRDKDKSCFRIFVELVKASKQHKALSSDEIAYSLNLSRGTVVHHLNKLMQAGIVVTDGYRYMLRVENLQHLMDELRRDMERSMEDLKEVARDIDNYLG